MVISLGGLSFVFIFPITKLLLNNKFSVLELSAVTLIVGWTQEKDASWSKDIFPGRAV
jgi:hypothetical protein